MYGFFFLTSDKITNSRVKFLGKLRINTSIFEAFNTGKGSLNTFFFWVRFSTSTPVPAKTHEEAYECVETPTRVIAECVARRACVTFNFLISV